MLFKNNKFLNPIKPTARNKMLHLTYEAEMIMVIKKINNGNDPLDV